MELVGLDGSTRTISFFFFRLHDVLCELVSRQVFIGVSLACKNGGKKNQTFESDSTFVWSAHQYCGTGTAIKSRQKNCYKMNQSKCKPSQLGFPQSILDLECKSICMLIQFKSLNTILPGRLSPFILISQFPVFYFQSI